MSADEPRSPILPAENSPRPFPASSTKRDFDARDSVGRGKQARKRHASESVLPPPQVPLLDASNRAPVPEIQRRTSSLDIERSTDTPRLYKPVTRALLQKYVLPLVRPEYQAKNTRHATGEASLDALDAYLRLLTRERIEATTRELQARHQAVRPDTLVPSLRERWTRVTLAGERDILRLHFFDRLSVSRFGADERLIALYEALELFTSFRPLIRQRLCYALQALPPERFDGQISPLLRILATSTWSSEWWGSRVAFADALCPKGFRIVTFASLVDYLGELGQPYFRYLQVAALPVCEALQKKTQLSFGREHEQAFADLLTTLAELPEHWLTRAGPVVHRLLEEQKYVGMLDLALRDVTRTLHVAADADVAVPSHWQGESASVLKVVAELTERQVEKVQTFAPLWRDELQAEWQEALRPDFAFKWASLLGAIARLSDEDNRNCLSEVVFELTFSGNREPQDDVLQSIGLIAQRYLRQAAQRQREAREPRMRLRDRKNTLPTVTEDDSIHLV